MPAVQVTTSLPDDYRKLRFLDSFLGSNGERTAKMETVKTSEMFGEIRVSSYCKGLRTDQVDHLQGAG